MPPTASSLTEEQKARIERNRQEALAKRARLQQQQQQTHSGSPALQTLRDSGDSSSAAPHAQRYQCQLQPKPQQPARQAPDVGVVMIDAHEASIIEQAMMAAQRRPPLAQQQQHYQSPSHRYQSPSHCAAPPGNSGQKQQERLSLEAPGGQALRKPVIQSPSTVSGPAVTITMAVTADGMFKAICPYHAGAVAVFKTIGSRSYDSNTRVWSFQVRDHDQLVKRLGELGSATVKPLPCSVIKSLAEIDPSVKGGSTAMVAASNEEAESKLQGLPPDLLSSLMPFQRDGVKFAITHGGRVLIGDEMGLGKTLQGIAIAKLYETEWPCLVVVPSALRLVWKHEFLRWLPDLGEDDLCVVMKSNERMHGRVTIISYDLLTRSAKSFGSGGQGSSPTAQFGVIIVDESHFLKSAKALRTKVIGPLVKRTKIAVLLSGTPALSRPAELYTQVSNLCPRLLPSWNDYAKRYCDAKQGRFGLESGGASNLEELRALLRSVMIRRLKAEVLTELPAKRRQQVFLDLPAAAVKDIRKKLHECSKLKCIVDNPSYPEAERKQAHTTSQQMLNELYMESGAAKIPHVNEYIKMLVEGGCKFLVFAHHKQVMDGICKELGEQKPPVHYIRIDGDTPMSERQRLVQAYQNDARMQVAVLSITAAGVGLTLTAANAVVFAELSWVPGNIIQAEDRAHRIGQQFSVNIHFLLAKDTIDDLMWPCIDKKLNVVANTLDGRLAQNFGDKQTHVPSVDISQPSIRAFLSQSPAGTWCEGGEGAGSAGYHAGGREGVGEERSTMCGRGSSVDAKMGQKSEGLPKGNTLGADHCLDQSRSKGDYAIHAGGRKRQRVFEGDSDDE